MLILIYFQKRITRTQIHESLNLSQVFVLHETFFLSSFVIKLLLIIRKKRVSPVCSFFRKLFHMKHFLTVFCLDLTGYMIKAKPFLVSVSVYKLFHVKHYNAKSGSLRIKVSSDG